MVTIYLWIFFLTISLTIVVLKADNRKRAKKVISIALFWIITLSSIGISLTEEVAKGIKKIEYITPNSYTITIDEEINFSAYVTPYDATKDLLKIIVSDETALRVKFEVVNEEQKARVDMTVKAIKTGTYEIVLSNLDETVKSNTVTIKIEKKTQSLPSQPTTPGERIVYDTLTGKKYHYSKSCRYLKNVITIIVKTLEQAIQEGKSPCSACVK